MKRLIGFCFCLTVVVATAAENQPAREDFAYEAPIALAGSGSVYRLPLNADVYRVVTRRDLGDIRLYNETGQVVPYGLSWQSEEAGKKLVTLPLFPLLITPAQARGDVSMQIKVTTEGSIIEVSKTSVAANGRTVYIADVSRIVDPLQALEISWDTKSRDAFIADVEVEESDDLKVWRSVGRGALAHLVRDGQTLEQRRIPLSRNRPKYLRLSWTDATQAARIAEVKAELSQTFARERDWQHVVTAPGEQSNELRFTLEGSMPVDQVRVMVPANSVASIAVLSRDRKSDPWQRRGFKTVYRINTPAELVDNVIPLSYGAPTREWMLRFDQGGSALGQLDGVEIGWIPHRLVFIARGDGPFYLAYGHAAAQPSHQGIEDLLDRLKRETGAPVEVLSASLQPARALRGDSARSREWNRGDWKQLLLWAVLVLGVGVLAFIAWRLVAQLPPPGEPHDSDADGPGA